MQLRPFESPRVLGRTGLEVGAIGLGSSYGVGGADIERAFERGVRLFLWGSRRRPKFAEGVRALAPRRAEMVVGIQSYTRVGALMKPFVTKALKSLGTDHVDLLGLAWWNDLPSRRILDAAMKLRDQGLVRQLMVSCHHRPSFQTFLGEPAYAAWMLRYNAAHPGAERDVFPHMPTDEAARPGVVAFTATRWGSLVDPANTPAGEPTPRASDCYRFALTNPFVDVVLAGPRDGAELDEALAAIDRGPMSDDELAWMKRVGAAVRKPTQERTLGVADRLSGLCRKQPPQLTG
jgi:aryl-alcohol dehydrogenase-like predicted oxidoreductase